MLDLKKVRMSSEEVVEHLKKRNFLLDTRLLDKLDSDRKKLQQETETLQNERNRASKMIGQAKANGQDIQPMLASINNLKEELDTNKSQLEVVQNELKKYLSTVPNIPSSDVPGGLDESANLVVSSWGECKEFSFTPKEHTDLSRDLDFESASKITGSRFVVMKGAVARLHRALSQFMLDKHVDIHGYTEINAPLIVNSESLFGTGQLPKFEIDLFKVSTEDNYYLIPTAEVPVANLVRDTILDSDELPLKLVCHTPCFRSEAGSYGRDTKGMIRQHQFEKVELVQVVRPEESEHALEELTSHAEEILRALGLPYRKVLLCGGDLGFSATKTFDLEVWLPSQNCYREISSCSNCGDFQARRLQARWRNPGSGKPELVHTLNGSGLAVGRTLVAVLENFQSSDGSVDIPDVLKPYMAGLECIN
jgi:seryl-tRNA synthetase